MLSETVEIQLLLNRSILSCYLESHFMSCVLQKCWRHPAVFICYKGSTVPLWEC